MLTPPKDILNRSMSTQIQWAIIIGVQLLIFAFILNAGFVYSLILLGINIDSGFNEILIMAIITTIIVAVSLRPKITKTQKLSGLNKDLQNAIATSEDKLNEEIIKKSKEDGLLRKLVRIEYEGNLSFILMEVEVEEEVTEEEKEEIFSEILKETFTGFIISTKVIKKPQS
jgi:DNA-binding protein YbaB